MITRITTVAVVTGPSSKALWYLTRGTGVVSLVFLTASVLLGITTSVRWENRAWPRWIIEGLHRSLSLLVVVFIGIHVATTVVDGFAPIGWLDAVVPFRSPYRPIWLGLGALSLDMLLAIALTSIFRARLGQRVWRAVHWLAYACWPVALVHALGTGSDAREGWMVLLAAGSVAAVLAAVAWRLTLAWPRRARGRWVALAAGFLAPILLAAWAALGPLRPGWAKVAGTPVALAAQVDPAAPAGAPAPARSGTPGTPAPGGTVRVAAVPAFDATFNGTMTQSGGDDDAVTLDLQGALAGGPFPAMDIRLNGQPLENGSGVSLRSGDVALGPAADPSAWQGRITGLRGGNITATVTDTTGRALDLTIQVTISRATGAVHGTVNAVPTAN